MRIVVTGQIAQYPLGGVAWFYLHYALGVARLGHDTYYVEDSGQWPYSPHADALTDDCEFNVDYLSGVMSRFGLADKWAYRHPRGPRWFGLSEDEKSEVLETADLLINVSGTLERPWEYRAAHRLAYVDTDPVFTQVKLARGQQDFRRLIDAHDVHFSYGECMGSDVPDTGHRWRPTRTPVVLSEWGPTATYREAFTTVMNWTSDNDISFDGRTYGQKNVEFQRFLELPSLAAPTFLELAMGRGKTHPPPRDLLTYKGWHLVDPADVCPDLDSFRDYTQTSKAEWGIAKHGYVLGQSGWFSERSARYLAAGRPVVIQDTGFSRVLPTGDGIVPFTTLDEAVAGIKAVEHDYEKHSHAARAIAEEWFDSNKVLSQLIEEAVA